MEWYQAKDAKECKASPRGPAWPARKATRDRRHVVVGVVGVVGVVVGVVVRRCVTGQKPSMHESVDTDSENRRGSFIAQSAHRLLYREHV